MKKLILASASPRRKDLLKQIGAEFEIHPAKGEEIQTKESPKEVVMELALQKAREVAGALGISGEEIILGADTVVAYEGAILGKPKDEAEAERMLSLLNGNTHSVYTGVALILKEEQGEQVISFYEKTQVVMYPMSKKEMDGYIKSGEPMDKAGAYGIQGRGAVYVEKIIGDYNNVVGLPLARIYQEMSKLGIEI